jgi:hypothetical protein
MRRIHAAHKKWLLSYSSKMGITSLMKRCFLVLNIYILLFLLSCTSQIPVKTDVQVSVGDGVLLDEALVNIAAYYMENLPPNTKIALLDFKSEAQLLSDYIFEELWIQFEDNSSFTLVDRQNLELIQAVQNDQALRRGDYTGRRV